eukprot:10674721-Heterocapsa_arctica.AAC.1
MAIWAWMRTASPMHLWATPACTKPAMTGSTPLATKSSRGSATKATSLVELKPRAVRYALAACGSSA